jgi:hypothetical protein
MVIELRAEQDLPPLTGPVGGPLLLDSNAASVDTGGSGMPPVEDIQSLPPFSFKLPLFMSEETRHQQDTTDQYEDGGKTAAAGHVGEYKEVLL